ncbi:MAG: MFS transporter [Thermoguttaceae bacterium]|nr:MFS transporter [Thermoguttaceae bacterium]
MPQSNWIRYYRWELLVLLFLAYFFHQADRAIFGIVTAEIKKDLGLSSSDIGVTSAVLFATLALMVPIAGFVGDLCNKKWVITISILFWSLSTMMTGWAGGLIGLIIFRSVATAGGESFYAPPAVAMIAAYHQKTRSLALSIHQAALYIGVITSGFLAGWIVDHYGWRSTFLVYGIAGIIVGILFIFRLRGMPQEEMKKQRNPQSSDTGTVAAEEQARAEKKESGTMSQSKQMFFRQVMELIVRTPSIPLLTVGFVAIVFVNNAYLTWAPMFLMAKYSLNTVQAGGFSMFYHHITALIFIMISGVVSDIMVRRYPAFRIYLQGIAMLIGAPVIYMMGATGSLAFVYLMMLCFGAVRGLYEANTQASMFDVVPPNYRATIVGLMIMTAFLFGSISPYLLGKLQDWYGEAAGLSYGFQILSVSWLIGAVSVMTAAFLTFKKDRYVPVSVETGENT